MQTGSFNATRAMVLAGRARSLAVLVLALLVAGAAAGASAAHAESPWWHIVSSARPATLQPGGTGTIVDQAFNVGNGSATGPMTLHAVLPSDVTVQSVEFHTYQFAEVNLEFLCTTGEHEVTCTTLEGLPEKLLPYEYLEVDIGVHVESGATPTGESLTEVSGGGGPTAKLQRPLSISSSAPAFGAEYLSMTPESEGGSIDAQAGSHPYQLTTTFNLNQTSDTLRPPALARNLAFKLPAGLVGNATGLPQCSDLDFRHVINGGFPNLCPADTVIGVAAVTVNEPSHLGLKTFPLPIFNLVPEKGEPARLGFEFVGTPVTLDTSVRTGSDYGVTVSVKNITQLTNFLTSTIVIWGVPGATSHDHARGWDCLLEGALQSGEEHEPCQTTSSSHPAPYLTLPTSCSTPLSMSVEGTSWPTLSAPEGVPLPFHEYQLADEFGRPISLSGCNRLPFDPSLEVSPDTQQASTPSGVTIRVRQPQEASENGEGLASSNIRSTTLTLPEGLAVNAAAAGGLLACPEGQVGFTERSNGTSLFTPTLPEPFCPSAARVGTVKLRVPILANPVEGSVYLATQNANPFGSLVAIYVVAEDPVSGVLVKLAGEVKLTETGQLITTLENTPDAPVEEAEFHLFGGNRAPLVTPAFCGAYTSTAAVTPWSGTPTVNPSSTFQITSGRGGAPCPSSKPFAPTLVAGMSTTQAGAFAPLTTTISREDTEQALQSVQLHTPPGLSGILTGVPLCPEEQANAGTCGPESLIGHASANVGLGNEPYTVTGGQVFLTAGYKGAPFGLSIVTPAKAGPFDLGNVIVRAKIEVDPLTAALTVTTDAIPHILKGIPLEIKNVTVSIDRPAFTFNPTSCATFSFSSTIGSVEGASAPTSMPFQAVNCTLLKFAPKFAVSTAGKTTKANGASLNVKLTYPSAPIGTYANVAKVKVSLPKQLPSRLTTLQKACLAAVFEKSPTGCPAASIVGKAKVLTPVLPVPLEGNAYFVSHGGEAFPDLTIVLHGYGVTVELVGSTQIKNGITTSTFKATPDVPFSSFELTLPQQSNSALAANANLCASKLTMPTEFTAQNGAVINQSTPISVTGCPKPLTNKQKLTKALKECHKKKNKGKRSSCEKQARRRFPVAKKKVAKKKAKK
jgi:hypothetical protein